jgi:ribosome biogenesis GTPase
MSEESQQGIVLEGTGGVWQVWTPGGKICDAALRGRLKQEGAIKLAVGDDVTIERASANDGWAIAEIHPRRSKLARRDPRSRFTERVVVSNIDQVVVVFAFAKPEPHARMIDRFLVIAEANGITSRVVMNKCELVDDAVAQAFVAPLVAAGYPVHLTSVDTARGLDALRDVLAERRSALSGPSGVGKSSLLSALYPGSQLRIGEMSESVNKGRHTTVGAKLLALPDGGFVADTPGLREVGLWGIEVDSLAECFPEFRPYLGTCRFQDCAHHKDKGCAVLAAAEAGSISAERHASFVILRAELIEMAPTPRKSGQRR